MTLKILMLIDDFINIAPNGFCLFGMKILMIKYCSDSDSGYYLVYFILFEYEFILIFGYLN